MTCLPKPFPKLSCAVVQSVLPVESPCLAGLLEYITVHSFRQCAVVDTECERVKLPVTYVHRLYLAYVAVLLAFRDLQDGFSLVVQFRTYMSPCIVIPLFKCNTVWICRLYPLDQRIKRLIRSVDSLGLLMSYIKSRIPSMMSNPTSGMFSSI